MTIEYKSLAGQTAIVTGAGQGIGFAIAGKLADNGCNVLLNDIDEELAHKAADEISTRGGQCIANVGDVSDPDFIPTMVTSAVETFGELNIAIANAGTTIYKSFLDYSHEDLMTVVSLNLGGTFFLAQAASKQMIKQGKGGRLMFMSSVTGHQAHRYLESYGMTKAGIEMLAKGLVAELAPFGITVNTVAPGATITERTASVDPNYAGEWARITPGGRAARPSDVADTVAFLVSPQAEHITGQSLVIDGGWTSVSPEPRQDYMDDNNESVPDNL